ncbi:phosphatidic acid phosphatase type [Seminavis robusta]|uniref:Phosphatidic acid phosphatase type n=1 Tax=Seminavis robusta TaxID=568900 RepID=A0A9N8ES89_9STRA|nr:phosphatidic acid phosphatase type [Seminavis robusta]|eukprot:Sro1549_g281640.1 phosphatidic acid phosphatase type (351) ;mRNA; f:12661-13820
MTRETEHLDFLLPSQTAASPSNDGIPVGRKAMAATSQQLSAQRTFDSDDDLLVDHDVDVVEENPAAVINTPSTILQSSPAWDCRAVHWPPRSWKSLAVQGRAYADSLNLIFEVSCLGVFVLVCYILPNILIPSHQRPIPIQTIGDGEALIDLTFDNEYHQNETVPGSLLAILCVGIPFVLFALMGTFLGPRGDAHAALCSYLLAMALKIFAVACIKNYAGYLRPNFYNMCQFNSKTLVCDDETTSARESFPSGHAATALSSMTLVALFFLGKVRGGTRQRGVMLVNDDPWSIIWTPSLVSKLLAVLAVSPIMFGMLIAASRVRDGWHHPADVVCGGVVGVGCALFAHSLW